MTDSMHRHTPSLTVFDSRGLTVRQTAYYRAQIDLDAQACVNAQVYDNQGRVIEVWDPRLFELRSIRPDVQPNLAMVYSLSGATLSSQSVDAGAALSLSAESGVVLEQWDARATHWQTEYDDYPRPIAIHEQMAGQPSRTCERFTYAGSGSESALRNQCGQLIRVDDSAGTLAITEYGLLGGTLLEERRLLTMIEPPDWPPSAEERDALLEPGQGAVTRRQFDATGTAISATDARGHLQSMGLNIAGHLAQVTLTLKNSPSQLLLRDVQYNANEQITSQTAGNGVISQYLYNDRDARLATLKTTRAANDPLQLLTYGYDPVGNVTSITDDAQAVRHFANQRIEPINRYTYDSFYQLVEAQGRETAKVSSGPQLPDMQPLPIDSSQWLNFTERYRYDSAGNLTQLRHEGSQPYTRDFEVDGTSNRALVKFEGSAPPDFASGFDASGNLQRLSPGQTMSWDARNRLLKVTPVSRKDADDDAEHYVYDSSGQRVRKIGTSAARAASHTREVRYLPGLELRSDSANDEQLEVIVIQAGRCTVRCLHWSSGRPAGIENDQLRYSVDDHLGSSVLELDAHAHLISYEGYYPFGGTAWWAARSAVEAKYKVARYSGKERDASGLYYYGLRYYAPWLMRWVSSDPEGFVDGLNLYCMVRNNPINRVDVQGGQSSDLDDVPEEVQLAIFVLVTLASAGLIFWQLRDFYVSAATAYQAETKANLAARAQRDEERTQNINRAVKGATSNYSLTSGEADLLNGRYLRTQNPVSWLHIAQDSKGAINLYQAISADQHNELAKARHIPSKAQKLGINPYQLRTAREPRPPLTLSNDSSASASANSTPRTSIDAAVPGTSAELRAVQEGLPQKRGSTVSNASLGSDNEITAPAPASRVAGQIFTMDPSGFFEDADIVAWLRGRPGMKDNLRAALDRFNPNRKGHTGLLRMKTTDIPSGTAGGRGDLRLGFTVRGNVFYPQAILSHKGKKGTILAQRRA
ncbi:MULTISPECIES: RHS repeat-associated core domain-containing protein [unclassified Pseudomonas]|uniref:RHS repeat domain-containing protein n=1 Tax=unclassified Pseudomonas TaxID=196821 RepID=UPI000D3D2383|nr:MULTISPECIES: RHS repeat-associated core domain-containing protein [unclassified Pseudomonas]RAU43107.1 RHS repeat protein [Pseudomonas sp. RIT 409]RAU53397.1 RHS repeat protein [Pseudomonas sp. RIT 412]